MTRLRHPPLPMWRPFCLMGPRTSLPRGFWAIGQAIRSTVASSGAQQRNCWQIHKVRQEKETVLCQPKTTRRFCAVTMTKYKRRPNYAGVDNFSLFILHVVSPVAASPSQLTGCPKLLFQEHPSVLTAHSRPLCLKLVRRRKRKRGASYHRRTNGRGLRWQNPDQTLNDTSLYSMFPKTSSIHDR